MKKTIIALLLIACVCIPAFAEASVFPYPSAGISATVGFDKDGVTFEGVGVYADIVVAFECPVAPEARIGFNYSFSDSKQTGLYVDLLATFQMIGGIGAGVDFHIVDGKIATNASAVLRAGYPAIFPIASGWLFGADLLVRYTFLNNAGTPAFSAGIDVGALCVRF